MLTEWSAMVRQYNSPAAEHLFDTHFDYKADSILAGF